MPKKIHDCATKLQGEGKSEDSAWAICTASIEEQIMKEVIETKLKECRCQHQKK